MNASDVSDRLGVEIISEFGGRNNRHWLVHRRGDRLVLKQWADGDPGSFAYEKEMLGGLAAKGWPVAVPEEAIESDGQHWSLSPYLPGEPRSETTSEDRRARGRLLAKLHADTMTLGISNQRPGWRRCEEILADENLDRILAEHDEEPSDQIRRRLSTARALAKDLELAERPSIPIHGDFAPWNLLYSGDRLTGLIDFELARHDHRVADFSLAWRGKYDDVIYGYEQLSPLSEDERLILVVAWWATLIDVGCRNLINGLCDDGWTANKLRERSSLMDRILAGRD